MGDDVAYPVDRPSRANIPSAGMRRTVIRSHPALMVTRGDRKLKAASGDQRGRHWGWGMAVGGRMTAFSPWGEWAAAEIA
jgi:hypothetical protein